MPYFLPKLSYIAPHYIYIMQLPFIFLSFLLSFLGKNPTCEDCITATEAAKHIGETVKVQAKIAHIYTGMLGNSSVMYFNLEKKFPQNPLAIRIEPENQGKFKDKQKYDGKTIIVTGKVYLQENEYSPKPCIRVENPTEIEILPL